ncbi:MAG TPA: ABC transporter substrate-binding protein [Bdellovibrionota bacterium]|nr:ABC transporter substrate-binding protein [Bdellovibrionota bacterium]
MQMWQRFGRRTLGLWAMILLSVIVLGSWVGCNGQGSQKEVWIYTSIYKSVIDEISGPMQAAFPGVKIQWFQGGSEVVAAKVNAELAGGGTHADLLLTSDPFWYLELKRAGLLVTYDSSAASAVDPALKDPDHAFVTVRIPVMVIAQNPDKLKGKAPASFHDLIDARFKDQVTMGSPLESGTNFTAAAFLSEKYGWNYFKVLRAMGIVAAGGNSSVMTRVETGERPLGILLLENILAGVPKGTPVKAIYPTDGAVPIPSPIAIVKQKDQPEEVKKIYDWFFSELAQKAIVKSGMYSPLPTIPAPEGALSWAELKKTLMPWTPETVNRMLARRDEVKKQFTETVLH